MASGDIIRLNSGLWDKTTGTIVGSAQVLSPSYPGYNGATTVATIYGKGVAHIRIYAIKNSMVSFLLPQITVDGSLLYPWDGTASFSTLGNANFIYDGTNWYYYLDVAITFKSSLVVKVALNYSSSSFAVIGYQVDYYI